MYNPFRINKWKLFFLFVAMSFPLLLACGGQRDSGSKTLEESDIDRVSTDIYCSSELTVTEEGTFFPVLEQTGGILTYYDFENKKEYPLCSNVNCKHKDESCNAWFASFASLPATYRDKVYLFSYDNDQNKWDFISMDFDGTNRKVLTSITPEDLAWDSLAQGINCGWYQNGWVIFKIIGSQWDEETEINTDFSAVAGIDLSNGEFKVYAQYDSTKEFDIAGCYGHKLLLSRSNNIEPEMSEAEFFEKNGSSADYAEYYHQWYVTCHQTTYYTLDTETGEEKKIADVLGDRDMEVDYSHNSEDGKIYYSLGKTLGGFDLESGTMETVYESDHELSMECVQDGKIFFLTLDDEREERIEVFYFDLEKKEITQVEDVISGGGWIYAGNSNYFVGTGRKGLKYGYVAIPKEDYYNSNSGAIEFIKSIL